MQDEEDRELKTQMEGLGLWTWKIKWIDFNIVKEV
jgi:hypothetical protein